MKRAKKLTFDLFNSFLNYKLIQGKISEKTIFLVQMLISKSESGYIQVVVNEPFILLRCHLGDPECGGRRAPRRHAAALVLPS